MSSLKNGDAKFSLETRHGYESGVLKVYFNGEWVELENTLYLTVSSAPIESTKSNSVMVTVTLVDVIVDLPEDHKMMQEMRKAVTDFRKGMH